MKIARDVLRRLSFLVFIFGIPPTATSLRAQTVPNPRVVGSSPSEEQTEGLGSEQRKSKAAAELRQQEHQRILGVMPNFNTSNVEDPEALSPRQKFELAAKGALDPFTFVAAGWTPG